MKRYENNKKIIAAALLLALLFSLASCGASGKGGEMVSGNASAPSGGADMAAPASAPAPQAAREDMAMDYGASGGGKVTPESAEIAGGGGFTDAASIPPGSRKITFSASFSISTKNYDADYAKINEMITGAGGYIANENTFDYSVGASRVANGGRNTWLSARVPANGYDSFLTDLETVGDVESKNKSSSDLTSEYFDTEARIEMLTIRKDRLTAYLAEAEEAADIVEYERELSSVLYELDQYQGNKRRLDALVDYATVDINLTELITPETIGKDGEPLGDRASNAFLLSVNGVERFLQNTAIFFAAAAPVIILLIIIGVIVLFAVKGVRALRARFRKPSEGTQQAQYTQTPPQEH